MTWFLHTPVEVQDCDLAEDMSLGWQSREEAEAWLSSAYPDLLAEDIHEVVLLDGEQVVYTMALDEAE